MKTSTPSSWYSSSVVQGVGILTLTLILLTVFFRGTDFAALAQSIRAARPELLIVAVLVTMVTYVVRAMRWRVLLTPLGRPTFWNCFETTVIGFMVNFVAGRLGEIARPVLLARREKFSVSSTLATIVLERVLDLASVVLLVAVGLVFGLSSGGAAGEVGQGGETSAEALSSLRVGGGVAFGAAMALLFGMFLAARFPSAAGRWIEALLGWLPDRVAVPLMRFSTTFIDGLRVLVDGGNLAKATAYSVALWLSISMGFWLTARAFSLEFSYTAAFLVIGFLTVGVSVPTPGAVGGYHLMGTLALTMLFQAGESVAKAVSLVSHAISFVPVTVLGLVLFMHSGLSLRQVKSMSSPGV